MQTLRSLAVYVFSAVVLFGFTQWLLGSLMPFGCATSPDSLAYLDIAANIHNGLGWRATDFSFDKAGQGLATENHLWPPLYPFLLAAFVDNWADVVGATAVSKALFFISALLTFLILARKANWLVALGATFLILVSIPSITIYSYAWSETLFVPLCLFAAFSAIQYLAASEQSKIVRLFWMLSLTLSLILVFYTRYIGIALVCLLPLTYVLSRRDRWDGLLFLAASATFALPVGYLLYWNYTVAGSLSGGPRMASESSIGENLAYASETLASVWPNFLFLWLVAGVLAVCACWAWQRFVGQDRPNPPENNAAAIIFACLGFAYLVMVIVLRSVTRFDDIDVRLLAPAFLLLLIAVFLAAQACQRHTYQAITARFVAFFLLIAFAINGYTQFAKSLHNWSASGTPGHILRGKQLYNNFTKAPADGTKALFAQIVEPGGLVLSDRPQVWRFISGISAADRPAKLDQDALRKFRELPKGSVMLVQQSEFQSFVEQAIANSNVFETVAFGELLALRLRPDA